MADKPPLAVAKSASIPIETDDMPEEVAFRVLKRRPLSVAQARLLATLLKNGKAWTTAKDLQNATKYNPSQLAGLFGAFGKRVTGTDGYEDGMSFFEWEWDYESAPSLTLKPNPSGMVDVAESCLRIFRISRDESCVSSIAP
jgi:hypothetical protein